MQSAERPEGVGSSEIFTPVTEITAPGEYYLCKDPKRQTIMGFPLPSRPGKDPSYFVVGHILEKINKVSNCSCFTMYIECLDQHYTFSFTEMSRGEIFVGLERGSISKGNLGKVCLAIRKEETLKEGRKKRKKIYRWSGVFKTEGAVNGGLFDEFIGKLNGVISERKIPVWKKE